jgi:hypothetical protein
MRTTWPIPIAELHRDRQRIRLDEPRDEFNEDVQ